MRPAFILKRCIPLSMLLLAAGSGYAQDSLLGRGYVTLPRAGGYKTAVDRSALETSLQKAGLKYVHDSVSYGSYYFDSSRLAYSKKKVMDFHKDYFYRVFGLAYHKDTLPQLLFSFRETDKGNRIEPFYETIHSHGIAMLYMMEYQPADEPQHRMTDREKRERNRKARKENQLVRKLFVKRFVK